MYIKGKVVEILDNRTIAINVGMRNSVTPGMIFEVFDPNGKTITDPDTKEVLGTVRLPKIKVKVKHVDLKFSIAETFQYDTVNIGGQGGLFNVPNLFTPPKYDKKYKTFNVNEVQKEKIEEERSYIKVGDLVEQVIGYHTDI